MRTKGILVCLALVTPTLGCARRFVESGVAAHDVVDQFVSAPPILTSETGGHRQTSLKFRLPNQRTSPMVLALVDKNCGCQEVKFPEQPIAGGNFAEIDVVVDPPAGAQTKSYRATVQLSWGAESELVTLGAEVQVLPVWVAAPVELAHEFVSEDFTEASLVLKQRVRSDTEPIASIPEFFELPPEVELVSLEHGGEERLKVEGRESTAEDAGVERRGSSVESQNSPTGDIWEFEWRAALRLKRTERVGDGVVGLFSVRCGEDEWSQLQIPVRLRVVAAVQASPGHTYFGRVRAGEERRRTVLLRSRDQQ